MPSVRKIRPARFATESSGTPAPRILIIDDDEKLRSLVRRSLESVGFEVDELGTARAVRRLREERAHLMIVDVFMPRQEGIETLMEQRRGAKEEIAALQAHLSRI